MKVEIQKIISDWMTPDGKEKHIEELATRLDKAIGIDEEYVTEILEQTMKDYDLTGFVKREIVTINYKMLAEAIATSRPLKCEVEE